MTVKPDPSITIATNNPFKQVGNDAVEITFQDGHKGIFTNQNAIAFGWKPSVSGATTKTLPQTPATSTPATSTPATSTPGTTGGTQIAGTGGDILNTVINANTNMKQLQDAISSNPALQKEVATLLRTKAGVSESIVNDTPKLIGKFMEQIHFAAQANGGAGLSLTDYIDQHAYTNQTIKASLDPVAVTSKLNDFFNNNNLKYPADKIENYTNTIVSGNQSIADVEQGIRNSVLIHQYPAWADQIKAGVDVSSLAQPYITQLASTLEIDPNSIKMNDPRILKAMQATDAQGKPAYMPIWQFDQSIAKKDPGYQFTKGAWTDMNDKFGSLLTAVGVKDINSLNVPKGVGAQDFFHKLFSSAGTAGAPLDNNTWNNMVEAPNAQLAYQNLGKSSWYANEFPGMASFIASNPGVNPLDPQAMVQYKSLEATYRAVAISNNLSPSLYTTSAIGNYMKQNIDAVDFKSRVLAAHDMAVTENPATLAALQQYHGIDKSGIASFYLDPKNSVADLTDISKQAQLGGLAKNTGLNLSSDYSLSLAQDAGAGGPYRETTIRAAEQTAGQQAAGLRNIAAQSSHALADDSLVKGSLDTGSKEGVQLSQLAASEAAKFSGSGSGTQSLGKDVSGNY